jgi:hypothetical protein
MSVGRSKRLARATSRIDGICSCALDFTFVCPTEIADTAHDVASEAPHRRDVPMFHERSENSDIVLAPVEDRATISV